jgi:hypothetical protein
MFEKPMDQDLVTNKFGNRVHISKGKPVKEVKFGSSIKARETQGALNKRTGKETVRLTQDYKNNRAKLIEDGEKRWQ